LGQALHELRPKVGQSREHLWGAEVLCVGEPGLNTNQTEGRKERGGGTGEEGQKGWGRG